MKDSLRVARVAGIEVNIHYTWLIIFVLFAWTLSEGFFPNAYPGWARGAYWITGVLASVLLFVSVLIHEFAHSLVARARGLGVRSITLFIFGGVSNIEEEPREAGTEFQIAVVGPLTSLILAGIFWAGRQAVQDANSPAAAMLMYLAYINALLAAFNILPGFPLDGGRVLRSIVWGVTRDQVRATNVAGRVGQFFGWALIAFGVFLILGGNLLGGLWLAFIGWFLSNAAGASRQEITTRRQLSGIKVADVMIATRETVPPSLSVEQLVEDIIRKRRARAAPVSSGDRLVGIVTISDVKELPRDRWAMTLVEEIMTPQPLHTAAPEDDLYSALRKLAEHDINQLVVLRQGQLAGLLTRADVIRYIHMAQELRLEPPESKAA